MPELMEFDLRFSSYRKWILKKPYAYKVNNRIIEVHLKSYGIFLSLWERIILGQQ